MTANRLKLAALGLAAALATTMTFAATAPAYAADPAPQAAEVLHRDLNLAAASGERKLRARVKLTAEALCTEPNQLSLKALSVGRACIVQAIEGAEPQVRAAIERQRAAQYAARAAD